jgi:hypothetical protein
MKVTCAWCQHEGRPATLGERAPLEDPAETHGICRRHTVDLLNRMPSRSFPGIRLLLVVSAKESALYEHLQRELAGVSGVKVMLDRRRGDRLADEEVVSAEHRGLDRRIRQGEVSALGYTIIRFGKD